MLIYPSTFLEILGPSWITARIDARAAAHLARPDAARRSLPPACVQGAESGATQVIGSVSILPAGHPGHQVIDRQ